MKLTPDQSSPAPSMAVARRRTLHTFQLATHAPGTLLAPVPPSPGLDLESIRLAIREELVAVLKAQTVQLSPASLHVLPPLLTTEEFGFLANRSADWVRDQICTGRISAQGRPWAIPYRELAKYRVDLATAAQRLSQRSLQPTVA